MKKILLVNKKYPLKKELNINLKNVPRKISTDNYKLSEEALNHFINLRKELFQQKIEILLDDGYRSFKAQKLIYEKLKKEKGKEYANKIVAPIGTSEHHTGLAIDLTLKINGKVLETNEELFENINYFKKIHPILYKHGFILRYPKGQEKITGYPYEPWHIRYIGIESATDMKNKNIETLEEYILNNIIK